MIGAAPTLMTVAVCTGTMASRMGQDIMVAGPGGGRKYNVIPGLFFDFAIPAVPNINYEFTFRAVNDNQFVSTTSMTVRLDPDEVRNIGSVITPSPYQAKNPDVPIVTEATHDFGTDPSQPQPQLVLKGRSRATRRITSCSSSSGLRTGSARRAR